ncbi:MAG: hypothetical protein EBU68_02850 [Actinobacteria bacterium]|nr:hypothetical protein [Actinomycetota bacterium]NDB42647.1 hypothetical protein [Actinomycetota bacterium]
MRVFGVKRRTTMWALRKNRVASATRICRFWLRLIVDSFTDKVAVSFVINLRYVHTSIIALA